MNKETLFTILFSLVLAPLTFANSQVDEAVDLYLPPHPSEQGGEPTDLAISNYLEHDVQLMWIDDRGRAISYGVIRAGEQRELSTFERHTWLFRRIDGTSLAAYNTQPGAHVELSPATLESVRDDPRPRRRRRGERWIPGNGRLERHESADSKYTVVVEAESLEPRLVHYIESSPQDQLQPQLQSYSYPKPGDPMPKRTVRLQVEEGPETELSNELFSNPYNLEFLRWSDSSDKFWLLYNQRGHQVLRLLEISVPDGKVRTVVDEVSDTFIQYSDPGKNYHHFLLGNQLLWASERSGWNHLYRYDLETGEVLNAVTTGSWNVKRVVKVDETAGRVWFYAVGVAEDQDPYHVHFCRVDLDGSSFIRLTEGDGTHEIEFQDDGTRFLDKWSRVDLAPVHELRDSETGELIEVVERENAEELFGERPLPLRFHAPGRDGETEIWGILHFPKDFDPDKKYPVVECIYAGPHDHHVPKSFRKNYRTQHQIADEGMIVVQIDGMGTAWRSKAFHDVCYKNLRDAGFPDRIAWMKAAAEQHPQLDLSHVGVYGGSAGGQNAMAALLWHNDFYKVAVADCGCHDNRMDKLWWNEQWMGYPVDASYAENSNMENAHLLEGHLMLVVGELDNNVDPASTTQVVHKLIQADKDFDFLLVAGAGHGSAETPWASRKRLSFFKKHLLAE